MSWNIFNWFGNRSSNQNPAQLYCDNPLCKSVIGGETIAYSKEHGEIYHAGECVMDAAINRAHTSHSPQIQNVTYISRKKILKLLEEGKLKQTKGLESTV